MFHFSIVFNIDSGANILLAWLDAQSTYDALPLAGVTMQKASNHPWLPLGSIFGDARGGGLASPYWIRVLPADAP